MPDINRISMIRARLEAEFNPSMLEITDESHLHTHHPGHGNAGHFKIKLISDKFNGKTPITCHRMIYTALNTLMKTEIHALSIQAIASDKNS